MIRIASTGVVSPGTAAQRHSLRMAFERDHHVRLPQLLDPVLLERIRQLIERAQFHEHVHARIGSNKELCLPSDVPSGLLCLLLNGQPVFELIEQITGCPSIRCFQGRVYRCIPGQGHHDSWHGDLGDHRLVAFSLNLSPEPYAGGVLQIRNVRDKAILQEVVNTGFGDAIVFRLASFLEHRITDVVGSFAKTAFAGWFCAEPDYLSLVRNTARTQGERGIRISR